MSLFLSLPSISGLCPTRPLTHSLTHLPHSRLTGGQKRAGWKGPRAENQLTAPFIFASCLVGALGGEHSGLSQMPPSTLSSGSQLFNSARFQLGPSLPRCRMAWGQKSFAPGRPGAPEPTPNPTGAPLAAPLPGSSGPAASAPEFPAAPSGGEDGQVRGEEPLRSGGANAGRDPSQALSPAPASQT